MVSQEKIQNFPDPLMNLHFIWFVGAGVVSLMTSVRVRDKFWRTFPSRITRAMGTVAGIVFMKRESLTPLGALLGSLCLSLFGGIWVFFSIEHNSPRWWQF